MGEQSKWRQVRLVTQNQYGVTGRALGLILLIAKTERSNAAHTSGRTVPAERRTSDAME